MVPSKQSYLQAFPSLTAEPARDPVVRSKPATDLT